MAMPPVRDKPLIFLDVETSGLIPHEHEVLEICLMDKDGNILLHSKIKPQNIQNAQARALEINGYNEKEWELAPSFRDLAPKIHELLKWAIAAGHNPGFDLNFIKSELQRADPKGELGYLKGVGYHMVDTVSLAYEHLSDCGLTGLSLITVCKFLGVELKNAHSAVADTEAARQCYLKMHQASWMDRRRWRKTGR
jgi:DNA polymerase-3 subunit epsilon